MCGIVGGFMRQGLGPGIAALRHRGPDAQGTVRRGALVLGHTRLAIRDLDPRSDQPFAYRGLLLVYNGELWNAEPVRADLERQSYTFGTMGDTEVMAAALHRWGPDALLRLEGMFALAWTRDGETLYLARDRFGEVPLHVAWQSPFLFASEKKALLALGVHPASVADVPPGVVLEARDGQIERRQYYDAPCTPSTLERPEAACQLRARLDGAVDERAISDVPVCTLLSGGLDSALIAALLRRTYPHLVAYTAVHDTKSRDLRAAREVASHLGITLREVAVPAPDADDLAGVVRVIEMPSKAQVEIGWPCLKLAEAMHADGFKVTYSGEGSDELWASYGFCYHALRDGRANWHGYRKSLFLSQARKNFPRANKIFMARSVECRLPFLHTPLVELALSLPERAVRDGSARPKAVLQDAVADLLPPSIVRRPKLAFQDGLGIKQAIATRVASPERFYRAEYRNAFEREQPGPHAVRREMAV